MAKVAETLVTAKNGIKVQMTAPSPGDGAELLETMKAILKTSRHTLVTYEEFTFTAEQEEEKISRFLSDPDKLILTPKIDGRIIGMLDFSQGHRNRVAHFGEFGMSIHPDFQGIGIGRMMLDALLSWAKANPRIETVRLKVHAKNHRAISLYEKCGFVSEGKQIRGVKFSDGTYDDVIGMACHVSP
jgi:RimJ/RimL family protein N-acetyltransferase